MRAVGLAGELAATRLADGRLVNFFVPRARAVLWDVFSFPCVGVAANDPEWG